MNNLFGNAIPFLAKTMDFVWQRQEVISNNITNAETPGYKAQYVTFEDAMMQELGKAGNRVQSDYAKSIAKLGSQVHEIRGHGERLDENTVDTTDEMVELTRNSYQFQYLLRALQMDLTRFQTVMKR